MQTKAASPFAIRDFRMLYTGEAISQVGDYMALISLPYLVLNQTGSAALSAFTLAILFAPRLLSIPLSYLADLYPRLTVMLLADVMRAAIFAVLGLLSLPMPAVLVLVLLAGLAMPPFAASRSGIIREAVTDPAMLKRAYFWMNNLFQLSAVGMALGGALASLVDPRPALLINGATFLLSAVFLLEIQHGRRALGAKSASHARRQAWQVLVRNPGPRQALLLLSIGPLGANAAEALIVPYVDENLASDWLWLVAVIVPVSTFLGALAVDRSVPEAGSGLRHARAVMIAGCLLAIAGLLLPLPPLLAAVVTFVGVGLVSAPYFLPQAAIQQATPAAIAGSMGGIMITVVDGGAAVAAGAGAVTVLLFGVNGAMLVLLALSAVYLLSIVSMPLVLRMKMAVQ